MNIICGNCIIREIVKEDFSDIHSFVSLEETCRYQAWGPNSEADTWAYMNDAIAEQTMISRVNYNLAVFSPTHNRVVGTAGIFLTDKAEIGYTIAKEYWGKGLGTSIAKSLVKHIQEELHYSEIFATCDVLNVGSAAVLVKSGFVKTHVIEKHMNIRGRMRDTAFYNFINN